MDPTTLSRLSQMMYRERLQEAERRRFWAKQRKVSRNGVTLWDRLRSLFSRSRPEALEPCPEC